MISQDGTETPGGTGHAGPGLSAGGQAAAKGSACPHRFLDPDGRVVTALPDYARDRAFLAGLYRDMVLTRAFDEKAVALQRTGRLGTFAASLGQEAVGVAVASAMAPEDVLLPSFRDQAAQIRRGVRPLELLLYWGGDERGSAFADCREDFPVCIPVASHCPHATGVALAMQTRGEARIAACMIGDGATSKGDFYEALNVAGVWRLPTVFVISNNQWAISVPRTAQTAAKTLAQKAVAAGVPGEQVDGNDVLVVHEAVRRARARALSGEGPTLIEALTYRLGDHTTADDASRYREDEEVSAQWRFEPLKRIRDHLVNSHGWTRNEEEVLRADCVNEIEAAAKAYLDTPPEGPESVFDTLFATLPDPLARQRRSLAGEGGND